METTCCTKVYAKLDRWNGFRPCKGKVVRVFRGKGYCAKHMHRASELEAALNYGSKEAK
jgi:hypothetical protein